MTGTADSANDDAATSRFTRVESPWVLAGHLPVGPTVHRWATALRCEPAVGIAMSGAARERTTAPRRRGQHLIVPQAASQVGGRCDSADPSNFSIRRSRPRRQLLDAAGCG